MNQDAIDFKLDTVPPGNLSAHGVKVLGLLGSGPRGPSYLASPPGRPGAAVWVLRWVSPGGAGSLRERLRPDILDLASIEHPSLALPIAFGREPGTGRGYLLRPYVEGAQLASTLRGRPAREVILRLLHAAEPLGILHRFGFAHGNVSLANWIVRGPGSRGRASREPGVVLCDAAWWPARDAAGGAPSPAADLRALGEAFYRLLAGREPGSLDGGSLVPPSEIDRRIPLDLDRLVSKLLHPDPAKRYASASDLLSDLRLLAGRRPAPRSFPGAFLGRNVELARALGAIEDPRRPAVIAIAGEAGMGKSAFLRRLGLEAMVIGHRVVAASAAEEGDDSFRSARGLVERLVPPGPAGKPLRSRARKLLAPARGTGESARRVLVRGLVDLLRSSAPAPTLLVLDDVHLASALTVEALGGAVRSIAEEEGSGPPLSLALAFRSEPPFRDPLKPLVEALRHRGPGVLGIDLPPLSPEAAGAWLDAALEGPPHGEVLRAAWRGGGSPLAIRDALRAEALGLEETRAGIRSPGASHRAYLDGVGAVARKVLETLAILARPAALDLISSILGEPRAALRKAARALALEGTLGEDAGRLSFRHGSFGAWVLEAMDARQRKEIHGRVADVLEARKDASSLEVARHGLRSDIPSRCIEPAIRAARELTGQHDARAAAELYRAALGLLPRADARRREIARESADAIGRAGEPRAAAEVLEEVLEGCKGARAGALRAGAGSWRHRAGDVKAAKEHLEKGLRLLPARRPGRFLRERLRMRSELAEISGNEGDYRRAKEICAAALEELARAGGSVKDPEVRHEEMVLLGTMAHLELRQFRYAEARELFGRSLRVGRSLGPDAEKGLIWNNLGTLHAQEDRYSHAIECLERAARLARRLGDDSTLAILETNLATLHARLGRRDRAAEALLRAARHQSRSDSAKVRHVWLHGTGLTELSLGLHEEASAHLEAAISLGEELKDFHMASFDLVHLGDCRLFRGELKAAAAAYDRAAASSSAPTPIRSMVEARRALLGALRGNKRVFRSALSAFEAAPRHGIAHVCATCSLFLGWAHRLLGKHAEAERLLEGARAFFARARATPAEAHAAMELAAVEGESGRPDRALERLRGLRTGRDADGALGNPMLAARLLIYESRILIERAPPRKEEAAALLAEAEGRLVGRSLGDLEAMVRSLKPRLRDVRPRPGPGARHGLRHGADAAAAALTGANPGAERALGAEAILGQSESMRRVRDFVRQIAPSPLPVLIAGETGTGKEIIARAIHGESPRRDAAFVSLSCAALPEDLIEAELFGHARGAFTGAEADHAGLLAAASGGTFLFDEVADLAPALQAKLLRALERGRVRPIGSDAEVPIDVRFIFSTNRDLRALVEEGKFRRDLLFRVGAFEVPVLPLRERVEDIPLLAERFRREALGDPGAPGGFDADAARALGSHPWPGNVRELRNLVHRLALTRPGTISGEDVRAALGKESPRGLFPPEVLRSRPLPDLLLQLEREHLAQLHADQDGDMKAMARVLGITVRALYRRFERLGMRPGEL